MGAWGITAFESDNGLDAVMQIRSELLGGGKLELHNIIEFLQQHQYLRIYDATEGQNHTSPMALAEIMLKIIDGDFGDLDYDGELFADDNKFRDITSFIASKESILWLENYLSDTLTYAKLNASMGRMWGGWFKENDWISWQKHMETLVSRLNELTNLSDNYIDLISLQDQQNQEQNELETTHNDWQQTM